MLRELRGEDRSSLAPEQEQPGRWGVGQPRGREDGIGGEGAVSPRRQQGVRRLAHQTERGGSPSGLEG